ncbi:MAG: GAF domain-containing protein [Chloroflexi bacterium]|nr:GAF domain-containing protein [Chloroflexota bacterium]
MAEAEPHLLTELQARARQHAAAARLEERARAGIDLAGLLDEAAGLVAQTLEVEFCAVLEAEQAAEAPLRVRAGVGCRACRARHATLEAGDASLAGLVLRSLQPVVVEDLGAETRFEPPRLLVEHGVRSGIGVAIRGLERPFGLLGTFTARQRAFTPDETHFVQAVASVLALAIGRIRAGAEQAHLQLACQQAARAEAEAASRALRQANEQLALASLRAQELADEAEAARRRLAFLAEASTQLGSSLDYETTLQRVVRLALPALADWCGVDIVEEDGQIHRLAVAHVDPDKDALAHELRRYPPDPSRPEGVPRVLRTGQSLLLPDVSDAMLEAAARDAEHLRLLRALAPRSSMVVPLLARGRSLGAISLVYSESGRRCGPDDLALAEELARRAAVAIENARLYLQAQEGVRVRDQFLSTAAHELKTPVTAIKGYAQLLRQWAPQGHEPREARAFEVINRQCDRLSRLVQELLEVSRLQLGRLELRRQRFELGELAAEVVERMQPLAPGHRLTLHRAARAAVEADRERLDQALANLLDNAIKFSPRSTVDSQQSTAAPSPQPSAPAGEIEVRVAVRGGEAVVSVRDQGVGIPRERQAHLFEQFYRAHAGTRHDFGGMGVGLHLSREIVARHGGRMWFESEEGRGSTFFFSLPLAAPGGTPFAGPTDPCIKT